MRTWPKRATLRLPRVVLSRLLHRVETREQYVVFLAQAAVLCYNDPRALVRLLLDLLFNF